jgi:hypothetical protein
VVVILRNTGSGKAVIAPSILAGQFKPFDLPERDEKRFRQLLFL